MSMRGIRQTIGTQRGIAMVEFVIVLPILLMLVLATAEFGRAFMQYSTLTKSIRDAGRYAAANALKGSTSVVQITAALSTATSNLVVYGNVAGTGTALLPGLTPGNVSLTSTTPGTVVVSATYAYAPIFSSLPLFALGSLSTGHALSAAVTMRAL
jgi:Flp pilus assembly protein TadG